MIGAGCNVEWEAFPAELAATATACNLEAGRSVDRDALLDRFLDAARGRARRARRACPSVTARGSRRSAGASACERAHDSLEGDAVDVTRDGALVVRTDDGTTSWSPPATSSTFAPCWRTGVPGEPASAASA